MWPGSRKVKSDAHGTADLADTAGAFHIELDGSVGSFGKVDVFPVDIVVGAVLLFRDTLTAIFLTRRLLYAHSIQTKIML